MPGPPVPALTRSGRLNLLTTGQAGLSMRRMRVLLVLVTLLGCSQDLTPPAADAEPPPPETPDGIQVVEDGRYELRWDGAGPAFVGCDELDLRGYDLAFSGGGDGCVTLVGEARGSCRCFPAQDGYREWCLCPGLRRLTATFIDAETYAEAGSLDAYRVGE